MPSGLTLLYAGAVYRAMLPLLVSDPAFADVVRARHRATCFDSAPCYMHLDAGARALSEHVRSPVGKALIRCLFSCVAIVSSGFGRTDPAGEYWRDLPALRPAEARRHVEHEAGAAGERGPRLAEGYGST